MCVTQFMNSDIPVKEIPLLYTDIGRYYSGTNPIIIYGNGIAKWIQLLSHSQKDIHFYIRQLTFQLCFNGIKHVELLCIEEDNNTLDILLEVFKQSLNHVTYSRINADHTKISNYLSQHCSTCPLLLTIQGIIDPFNIILSTLIQGISVALLSERSLIPGDRLHGFIYLSNPHLSHNLLSIHTPIHQELDQLSIIESSDSLIKHPGRSTSPSTISINNIPIFSLVDMTTMKLSALFTLPSWPTINLSKPIPIYIQLEEDLYPAKPEGEKYPNDQAYEARRYQRFCARVHFYAASLQGYNLHRRIITTGTDEKDEKSIEKKHHSQKTTKKSKAQLIKEENEKRIMDTELAKQKKLLNTAIEIINTLRNVQEKLAILDNLPFSKDSSSVSQIQVSLILAKMDIYASAWKEDKVTKDYFIVDADFVNAVHVMETIFEIYDHYLNVLTDDQLESHILPYLCMFGFIDAASLFLEAYLKKSQSSNIPALQKRLIASLKVIIANAGTKYRIKCSYVRFQMLYCGHLFPRSLESKQDDRVLFKPDAWQVDLLDVVDRNESALICAPTSSGKTFICFYAMERILRSNNDDVVIYIAPNKALMNQVMADVYSRFQHKIYPSNSNRRLFGKLDDREAMHPFDAQILITFPDIFESFVMSPLFSEYIAKRVKYIILDEIHTIGEEGKGYAWEKIIMMAQCPILALSATVGNRKAFWTWLSNMQSRIGIPCRLIEHNERFSDLKRYVYDIDLSDPINKIDLEHFDSIKSTSSKRKARNSHVVQMHPLLSVTKNDLISKPLPVDYQFLSGDTLRLYDVLTKIPNLSNDVLQRLDELNVDITFKGKFRITKADSRALEKDIKDIMRDAIQKGTIQESVMENFILKELNQGALEGFQHIDSDLKSHISTDYLLDSLLNLLVDLSSESKLPVIVFNFDRNFCSIMATRLDDALDKAERFKKQRSSKEEKTKLKEIEHLQKMQKRQRDAELKGGKDAWIEESIQEEAIADLTSGMTRVDPELAFQDARYKLRDSEMDELIDGDMFRLTRKMTTPLEKTLLSALRRGIGVHHRGVPKDYLDLVEHLFRQRHLQVVFATSTLALGINMPCKTVVFAGDDISLSPLEYRQMSGRAGRRGYDDLGHVVFWGIPKPKCDRLITSSLPSIQGDYPITPTCTLQLHHYSQSNTEDTNKIVSTALDRHLNVPLFGMSLDESSSSMNTSIHFALMTDYLIRFGFLTTNGQPTIYSRLALLAPSSESGSFHLMYLFYCGAMEKICSEYELHREKTLKTLMNIIAHLFQPRYLPKSRMNKQDCQLECLPYDIQVAMQEYNSTLISMLSVLSTLQGKDGTDQQQLLDSLLKENVETIDGAVLLDATSFNCLQSKSSLLLLPELAMPFYYIPPHVYRNDYLAAYYQHTDPKRIEEENRVEEKDLWMDLYEVNRILQRVVGLFDECDIFSDTLVEAFQELTREWDKKFKRMWA